MLRTCRDYWSCQKCGAWRWCDTAVLKGESACKKCGTPWSVALPYPVTPPQTNEGRDVAKAAGKGQRSPKGGGKGKDLAGGKGGAGPKTPGLQNAPNQRHQLQCSNQGSEDPVAKAQTWLRLC